MADIPGAASKYSCLAEFEAHLHSYEEKTKTKFVVLKSDKLFGKTGNFIQTITLLANNQRY